METPEMELLKERAKKHGIADVEFANPSAIEHWILEQDMSLTTRDLHQIQEAAERNFRDAVERYAKVVSPEHYGKLLTAAMVMRHSIHIPLKG